MHPPLPSHIASSFSVPRVFRSLQVQPSSLTLRWARHSLARCSYISNLHTDPLQSQPQELRKHSEEWPWLQQRQTRAQQRHQQLDAPALLKDVRVVLVAPRVEANIGAVARAAENFEALDVWVVAPRCKVLSNEAQLVSSGSMVLLNMHVVDTVAEALADTTASIGFTRRAGGSRVLHPSLHRLLHRYPDVLPLQQQSTGPMAGSTALVFGREESGLLDEELLRCSHACAIPTGRVHGSLNLSHAVAVVLAQCFERRWEHSLSHTQVADEVRQEAKDNTVLPAMSAELDSLVSRWADVTKAAGLSEEESIGGLHAAHGRKRRVVGHLRSILLRAQTTRKEVQALHGLCSALLKTMDAQGPSQRRQIQETEQQL